MGYQKKHKKPISSIEKRRAVMRVASTIVLVGLAAAIFAAGISQLLSL